MHIVLSFSRCLYSVCHRVGNGTDRVNRCMIVCRPLKWCTDSKVKKQLAGVLVSAVLYNMAVCGGVVLSLGRPAYIVLSSNVLHSVLLHDVAGVEGAGTDL